MSGGFRLALQNLITSLSTLCPGRHHLHPHRAGEMRQAKSQKSLADAVAAHQLPRLGVLRAAARDAFVSSNPELYEITSAMGSKSDEVVEKARREASNMLVHTMRVCTGLPYVFLFVEVSRVSWLVLLRP
jgi:hypothetical protein